MNKEHAESTFINFLHQSYGVFELNNFSEVGIEASLKFYSKGSFLITQGKEANKLFFLISGLTRYVSTSSEGKEFTQSFGQAPRIAGSTKSMIQDTPALFSIEVLEDVVCLEFNWQDFFTKMKPVKGFLETYLHMMEVLFIGKEEREKAFVQLTAEQRYLNFIHQNPELSEKIPLQYIASYIGITPVALSRIRKQLSTG